MGKADVRCPRAPWKKDCDILRHLNLRPEDTMTQSPHDAPNKPAQPASDDDLLDEALDETFPASDPIAVHPERKSKDDGQAPRK